MRGDEMKLKYLTILSDFFTPEFVNNYTRDELISMGIRLRLESSYITDYIKRQVNEELDFDCSRINISCKLSNIRNTISTIDSICEVDTNFDLSYFSKTTSEKEKYLLNLIEDALVRFCNNKEIDFSIFKKHIDTFRSITSNVEFYIPKKQCKRGKFLAKVFCVHTITEIIYFIDIFKDNILISRKLLGVSMPNTMTYRSNIYRMKWKDNTITINSYYNNIYATIDVDTEQIESIKNGIDVINYKSQIDRVYQIKASIATKLRVISEDFCIDNWIENSKGQVLAFVSMFKKGLDRYIAVIDSTGDLRIEYCTDVSNIDLVSDIKKSLKWVQ